jgi:uroporphyrinogen decarboxylase
MKDCSPRERVVTALDHREPDRVPISFGCLHDSIHLFGHRSLKTFLGIQNTEDSIQDPFQQNVFPDKTLMAKFGADCLPVYARPAQPFEMRYSTEGGFRKYKDEWGTTYRQPIATGIWFDFESTIWSGKTAAEIASHKLPDPVHPSRFEGLRAQVQRMLKETDKAIVAHAPTGGIVEHSYWLRGMQDSYMDMASDPAMVELVAERVVEWLEAFWTRYMEEIGDLVQVVQMGDDLGGQDGPLFSPDVYRKFFKPRERRLIDIVKKRSRAKVYFHSCGAIREYIPDLIEIGVDALNPVQVQARNMDSAGLKRDFGKQLSFWGGGANPNAVMSRGTPEDVRREVKKRIEDLAPGGGFVFASVHNIQSDVPPQNVVAFFESALEYGKY